MSNLDSARIFCTRCLSPQDTRCISAGHICCQGSVTDTPAPRSFRIGYPELLLEGGEYSTAVMQKVEAMQVTRDISQVSLF
ncbi:hypothetical protein A0H81_09825 [Grifola frondosa]|uniref:Uncharacterized protein n=1 Tax=Grifola frondosa TaxID=5627 RepID=A0A1C7M1X8_GRIFR|nr:hypothetical protein A0H81_09825 [Grifola frondosa]